jgi:hypothetical protein
VAPMGWPHLTGERTGSAADCCFHRSGTGGACETLVTVDDHFSRTLLALRRFIGVPLPGTELRIHGLISLAESGIRVLLGTEGMEQRPVDLPLFPVGGFEKFPPWWYVTAIRDVAVWMSGQLPPISRLAPPGVGGLSE